MPDLLSLQNVSKHFGGVQAVDRLSIGFAPGKITALIGPNGAGKTTAFNLIGGLLRPDTGSVRFEDNPISGLNPWRITSLGIGRLFQDVRLFKKMTVLENVMTAFLKQEGESLWRVMLVPWTETGPEKVRREKATELLEKVGLHHLAGTPAENLSYGQQKLVAIARLLAADARLLLLDEPTAGVNPAMIHKLLETVKRLATEGKTVIFVEHNMEVVRNMADWVYFMVAGKVTSFGSPSDVLSDPEVQAAYIGRHTTEAKLTLGGESRVETSRN